MKWKVRNPGKKVVVKQRVMDNIFAELDYLQTTTWGVKNRAQVHNLVGTSRLVSGLFCLDLKAISTLLPNARFEKQKFAAITIRLGHPVCTVLLFTSGKMVLTGCKSMLDCILASHHIFHLLKINMPGVHFELEPIKIQNIVGNAQLPLRPGQRVDLDRFYQTFNVYCTYQPNMFPGLIYRPLDMPVVLLIFFSGKVVITGARNMADVYASWDGLADLLKDFKI